MVYDTYRAAIVEFCATKQETFVGRKRAADGCKQAPKFYFWYTKNSTSEELAKGNEYWAHSYWTASPAAHLDPPLLIMLFHVECLQKCKGASWSHGEAVIHLFCVVLFCRAIYFHCWMKIYSYPSMFE